jgi:hypothetical protein
MKTSKGTELVLTTIKGNPYLPVAQRLVWLVEDNPNFSINTEIVQTSQDFSVVRASVSILNSNGIVVKKASASKTETKQGFGDHLEKAETGAIGRALAMLGYGTQFTGDEFNERDRLADAPIHLPIKPRVLKARVLNDPAPEAPAWAEPEDPNPRAPVNHAPTQTGKISEAQVKRLFAIAYKSNWVASQAADHVFKSYKIPVKDLSRVQYDEACEFFEHNESIPF